MMITRKQKIKAIEDSLARWVDIKEQMADSDDNPCPLCELYDDLKTTKCNGCPLSHKNNYECCNEWHEANSGARSMIKRLKKELEKAKGK